MGAVQPASVGAGWHPDPKGEADERWWNGAAWTNRTRDGEHWADEEALNSARGEVREIDRNARRDVRRIERGERQFESGNEQA